MPRSLYRDTVMVKGPAGAIPLAGAAVEFKDATTGLPISFSLYPDNTSPLPLVQPYVTGDLGELEVWADLPHRVQITVTKNGLTQARETIDLEYPPEYGATDSDITDAVAAHEAKDDPHTQYLTQPEGNLRYLPLSHEPGVDPTPSTSRRRSSPNPTRWGSTSWRRRRRSPRATPRSTPTASCPPSTSRPSPSPTPSWWRARPRCWPWSPRPATWRSGRTPPSPTSWPTIRPAS